MDLKQKLGLLPPQRTVRLDPGFVEPVEGAGGHLENQTASGGGDVLDDLRRRMAAILGRTEPPGAAERTTSLADPSNTTLPFTRVTTGAGELTLRQEAAGGGRAVGKIPLSSAFDVTAGTLALLALAPALADVDFSRALYLDTETTGLGGAGTLAFLVGLAYFEEGELVLEQLLLRSPAEERAMLEWIAARVERASCLVTFNGRSFDWPLLVGRFAMQRLQKPDDPLHLDLLHVGRRVHRRRIGACSLKALEREVLGFDRDGDIAGADVAARYGHFLRTGDEEALRAVVDHNAWDVFSMVALVGLYGEPLDLLPVSDLLGLATALGRAKAFGEATLAADRAVLRGIGGEALSVRGAIAKARGDKAQALADFEAAEREIDDPRVRLELAKLYEHFVKRPLAALEVARRGTGESEVAATHRLGRLAKKAGRTPG